MYNPINSIIRSATRKKDEPLNILTYVAHERYEPNLALTGHNFYSLITDGTRQWNTKYSPIPDNYHIFYNLVPDYILNSIDVIISHNPFVHIPLAINSNLRVPIVNIFHTMPSPGWDNQQLHAGATQLFDRCKEHVYISDFNKATWGYNKGSVIYHGLDTDMFKDMNLNRQPRVLTVANDYINRNWCLGFDIWKYLSKDFPMCPVGETPGLSKPAANMDELIYYYNTSQIFLNTSTASPIPMSLLEAMSCGCAVVSTATCMIPEIIEHGKDGFLCSPNKPEKFKEYISMLLNDEGLRLELGKNARQKIQNMFSLAKFTENWNNLLYRVVNDSNQ